MLRYLLKRLLLIVPTLFGIIAINFAVVQFAPGGPIQTVIEKIKEQSAHPGESGLPSHSLYRGMQGLDPAMVAQLRQQFGFDKPPLTRFLLMLRGYLTFNLGTSFFQGQTVLSLVWQRLPVSISLGLWSTLIVYLISIPLGIRKAVRDGSRFDVASSFAILVGYAIPGFLLAIFLIVLFGSGGMVPIFPLRGLATPDAGLSWPAQIADYAWHLVLPTIAMTIGGFASLTMLTKNSFLEEIRKLYVLTARAKGASEARVLYGHVFRNAMLLVIAGFPAAFISILFTSALLVEIVFSLNGLGLLGYNAVLQRDYPVMFGTLYIYTLAGLAMQVIGDFVYTLIDPRIDFDTRP